MRYVDQLLKELGYWGISTVISSGLPVGIGFLICLHVFELPKSLTSFYVTGVGLVTATWGAWIALCASRSRVAASLERLFVSLPAVVPFVAGALTIYVGSGGFVIGGFLIAVALVLLFLAFTLSGRIRRAGLLQGPGARTVWGLVCIPAVSTAISLMILVAWYRFLVIPIEITELLSVSGYGSVLRFVVTVMAYSLVTTVIPGSVGLLVTRFVSDDDEREADDSPWRM